MTADAQYVVFRSAADNLVPDDTNGATDIFVHELVSGATYRASVDSTGGEGDGDSVQAAIADNGGWVAFRSAATNLVAGDDNGHEDIFVHDLATGSTALVSRADDGTPGNNDSTCPSISGDGQRVAFLSSADNLVANDTNGRVDVFVHDQQTGTTTRVSVASNGQEANGDSDWPVISSTGTAVVFQSDADNLVGNDTNEQTDIFKHTITSGNTYLVSLGNSGQQGSGPSVRPALPGPANHYILFASAAPDLRSGDDNSAATCNLTRPQCIRTAG
jgi:Tol biopolymer transport system component